MSISKYVFKCSAASLFKTHLTEYFCVRVFSKDFCGVPKMLLLGCCPFFFFFFGGQQTGCGGRQGAEQHTLEAASPGSGKGLSQAKGEVDGAPTTTHTPTRHHSPKFSHTNARNLCLPAFRLSPLCFSPPHFLPELHTEPEWASAAHPVFKHLARSLVSSFLQPIQEADKYC